MSVLISHPTQIIQGEIQLTSSKSLSNRTLIIHSLCEENFEINNLSNSDDTVVLQKLLNSKKTEVNVNLAGTAMRFLTAFFAIKEGEVLLTGDDRMKERPIKVLVDALRQLGADIEYVENQGYPPLKIIGTKISGGKVSIDGSVSSQYISALLMIAPKLKNGIQIKFQGEIISKPYINMTIEMMHYFGVSVQWCNDTVIVKPSCYQSKEITIEADWSAASYWYSMVALAKEANIILYGLQNESLQGDAVIVAIYKNFGVETEFIKNGIKLSKTSNPSFVQPTNFEYNFSDCPDIAQTVAVTCAALNIKAKLTGLKTLRIKETDRVAAIQKELNKLGCNVGVVGDDLIINSSMELKQVTVKTYNDHRMAMAFAPLALVREIAIEDENVVTKSYPNFWNDLMAVEFSNS